MKFLSKPFPCFDKNLNGAMEGTIVASALRKSFTQMQLLLGMCWSYPVSI